MCLLVIAWQVHPRYRLIVAANRDEFHERPTAPLARWQAPDQILAGRDLRAGGTWLGVDRKRRFGVVTNFRELQRPAPDAPSRGALIPSYLRGPVGPERYLKDLGPAGPSYSGFNLLLADDESLWYGSNRAARFARPLPPGVYGLSNEFLDTPWPKLVRVRREFDAWLAEPAHGSKEELFAMLADRTPAGVNDKLPQAGLTPEWEQLLSSPFVCHPDYGTRCSTVLLLQASGAFSLTERRFDSQGMVIGATELELGAAEWP